MTAGGKKKEGERHRERGLQTSAGQKCSSVQCVSVRTPGMPGREELRHEEDVKSGGVCQRRDCEPGKESQDSFSVGSKSLLSCN